MLAIRQQRDRDQVDKVMAEEEDLEDEEMELVQRQMEANMKLRQQQQLFRQQMELFQQMEFTSKDWSELEFFNPEEQQQLEQAATQAAQHLTLLPETLFYAENLFTAQEQQQLEDDIMDELTAPSSNPEQTTPPAGINPIARSRSGSVQPPDTPRIKKPRMT